MFGEIFHSKIASIVFIGQDVADVANINNIGPILLDTRVIFLN